MPLKVPALFLAQGVRFGCDNSPGRASLAVATSLFRGDGPFWPPEAGGGAIGDSTTTKQGIHRVEGDEAGGSVLVARAKRRRYARCFHRGGTGGKVRSVRLC